MKRISLIGSLAALAVMAGCACPDRPKDAAVAEAPAAVAPTPPAPPPAPKVMGMPGGSVYFDYDKYVVKNQYRGVVESNARYLKSTSSGSVVVEGNCDERGSREYNLALGQRRADAVKKAMVLLGASESRIETISYGEEKPRAMGHDEAAWAENRRADVVQK